MTTPDAASEHEANRPYRRLVGVVFGVAVVVLCTFVLRAVVRAIDRLPTAAALERPAVVDARALRACAEDLERLEAKIRASAARAFGEAPGVPSTWAAARDAHELEHLAIVARCRLDEPTEDAAVHDLERAAGDLEGLLREYNLLMARHLADGLPHAAEAREALERASRSLKTR